MKAKYELPNSAMADHDLKKKKGIMSVIYCMSYTLAENCKPDL